MPPLLGINLFETNENFAIKSFSEQVREISLMTVELPTPQETLQRIQIIQIMVLISNQRYSYPCLNGHECPTTGSGGACNWDYVCWICHQNRPRGITHKHVTYTVCSTHTCEGWDENIAWPSAYIRADTASAEVAKPRNLPSWPHLVPLTVSPSRSSFTPGAQRYLRQDVRLWLQGRLRGGGLWQGQGLDQECMYTFFQSSNFQTLIILFGNL